MCVLCFWFVLWYGYFYYDIVDVGYLWGSYEVVEFWDGDKNVYMGKGVLKVVVNVNDKI